MAVERCDTNEVEVCNMECTCRAATWCLGVRVRGGRIARARACASHDRQLRRDTHQQDPAPRRPRSDSRITAYFGCRGQAGGRD